MGAAEVTYDWRQYSVSIPFRITTPEAVALYLRLVKNESMYLMNSKYMTSVLYPEHVLVDAYGRPF